MSSFATSMREWEDDGCDQGLTLEKVKKKRQQPINKPNYLLHTRQGMADPEEESAAF